jgi:anaerobic ribonucleoside-triphosphate reductase activating protein
MTAINVAMIVDQTEAEGPGRRLAVWVQGCPMRCAGCCNPEMLSFVERESWEPQELLKRAVHSAVEGVSLLGGEPFSQAQGLSEFAALVQNAGLTVMVYTGYTLNELNAMADPAVRSLLAATDLLVDGRYERDLHSTKRRWIGSDNQGLHFLTTRYAQTDPRFYEGNTVELRMRGGRLSINGWPVQGAKTRVEK